MMSSLDFYARFCREFYLVCMFPPAVWYGSSWPPPVCTYGDGVGQRKVEWFTAWGNLGLANFCLPAYRFWHWGIYLNIMVLPRKLTWNLKIPPWKRRNIYKPPILGFHVSFRGCKDWLVPFLFTIGKLRARRVFWGNGRTKVLQGKLSPKKCIVSIFKGVDDCFFFCRVSW